MKEYCSAHLLVSEPSEISEPNFGLAADSRISFKTKRSLPAIHPVLNLTLPSVAAIYSDPLYR